MRYRKGCRRTNPSINSEFGQNFQRTNQTTGRNSQNYSFINQKMPGYTYIGRCRCGLGPNAYYKSANGQILHANQINQKQPLNPQLTLNNSTLEEIDSKIEMHRVCNKCGSWVRDDAIYCNNCGNELGEIFLTKKHQIEELENNIKILKNRIKEIKKSE
ncbi:MAG: hypothetical protein ACFFD2_29520 [Promethearchaeota archaeon]